VIVDCDDKFINIVAKWPGSSHDSRVFKEGAVYRNLENNNIDGYLLGDSGYACKTFLLAPYLLTYWSSWSDGAWILIWVPSISPITPGKLATEYKFPLISESFGSFGNVM
jgi:hypothetical protein